MIKIFLGEEREVERGKKLKTGVQITDQNQKNFTTEIYISASVLYLFVQSRRQGSFFCFKKLH